MTLKLTPTTNSQRIEHETSKLLPWRKKKLYPSNFFSPFGNKHQKEKEKKKEYTSVALLLDVLLVHILSTTIIVVVVGDYRLP